MPGDSGVLVVTRVRSTTIIAHETAGALGIRHSPRPLKGGRFINASGASRRGVANVCLMDTSTPSRHRPRPHPEELAKQASRRTQRRDSRPSFETRARGALLRMRSEIYSEPRKGAIQYSEAPVKESKSCGVLDTPSSGAHSRDPLARNDGVESTDAAFSRGPRCSIVRPTEQAPRRKP
jgi:hypothetical protein